MKRDREARIVAVVASLFVVAISAVMFYSTRSTEDLDLGGETPLLEGATLVEVTAIPHIYATVEEPIELVCIEWLDAKGELGWMTAEDYNPIARMISCGHLVSEDENFVVLAVDRSLEAIPYYNNIGSIPSGMVKRRWEVR